MQDYTVKGVAPDMTSAAFLAALRAASSPVSGADAEAVYAYCAARRVSPAWLLAVFAHESGMGKHGTATQTHSWGNTRPPTFGAPSTGSIAGRSGQFSVYADWALGGVATVARVCDHPAYANATTVRQITPIWAPPSDSNDTGAYIAAVLADIARYAAPAAPGTTKGMDVTNPTIIEKLTPFNHWGGRNGVRVAAVVIHVSEGGRAGVEAWFRNPASEASAHYLVNKDGTIWRFVDEGDTAWANGKLNQPNLADPLIAGWQASGLNPNRATISVETERQWTERLTPPQLTALAWLCADIHRRYGLPTDGSRLLGHNEFDSVDRARCPSLSPEEWDALVAALAAPAPPVPAPAPARPVGFLPMGTPDTFDWQGEGVIVARSVRYFNPDTGKYYDREWHNQTGYGPWVEVGN